MVSAPHHGRTMGPVDGLSALVAALAAHEGAWRRSVDDRIDAKRELDAAFRARADAQSAWLACAKTTGSVSGAAVECGCDIHGPEVEAAQGRVDAAKAAVDAAIHAYKSGATYRHQMQAALQ